MTYGDDHGVMKKLGIFGWPSDDEPSPPTAYLKYEGKRLEESELYLRDDKRPARAALGHFSLVVVLSEDVIVEIPFENDAPQLDKATLPKGYTVELMP